MRPVNRLRSARSLAVGAAVGAAVLALTGATPAMAVGTQAAASWSTLPAYPTPIEDNVVGIHDGTLYSVSGTTGTARTAAMFAYTPGSGWTQRASIPVSRENASGAFIGNRFYVTGGWDLSLQPTGTTNVYDPASDTWKTAATNPAPAAAAGTAVVNDTLYTIGGCTDSTCTMTDTVTAYDPTTDTWTTKAAYPVKAAFVSCAVLADKIYCAGGDTRTSVLNSAYSYDPAQDTWSPIADLPANTMAAASGAVNGRFLVQGGLAGTGLSSVTNRGWSYDPATDTWSALPASPTAEARGGSTSDGSALYVVGGRPTPSADQISDTTQVLRAG